MKRLSIFLITLVFTSSYATAQDPTKTEYGKPSEFKGLTKIFVDTAGDTEQRNRVLKEFEKEKIPGVSILDSSDEAKIILYFSGDKVPYTRGQVSDSRGNVGVESVKHFVWTAKPEVKFTREFIKACKEANGLK